MGIADRALSIAGTARTFALNFWPWLLAAFVIGLGTGAYPAYRLTRMFYRGEALEAKANLANFRADLATNAASAEVRVGELLKSAEAARRADEETKAAAVAAIPAQVAAILAPKFTALRESLNAPEYACLHVPLPEDSLRLLERPGGTVPAASR